MTYNKLTSHELASNPTSALSIISTVLDWLYPEMTWKLYKSLNDHIALGQRFSRTRTTCTNAGSAATRPLLLMDREPEACSKPVSGRALAVSMYASPVLRFRQTASVVYEWLTPLLVRFRNSRAICAPSRKTTTSLEPEPVCTPAHSFIWSLLHVQCFQPKKMVKFDIDGTAVNIGQNVVVHAGSE